MGDCGIAPDDGFFDISEVRFAAEHAKGSRKIKYENVFEIKSNTKSVKITRSSDGFFYCGGSKYSGFKEALSSLDAFMLHTTFILPVFVHLDVIEDVAGEINKVLKSTSLLVDNETWRKEWEVFLNRKSYYDRKRNRIQFLKPTGKPRCILPKHLGTEHDGLRKQLEEYLIFLFDGIYPYSLLNLSREERPEILRQHQIFSVLQLKYAHLLLAWTDKRAKIEHNRYAFWELDWVRKIEFEEFNKYFKNRDFGEPKEEFFLIESKLGKGTLWDRLAPLFSDTLLAYEEYLNMRSKDIEEQEALHWSGLMNIKHKTLAEFLINNYCKKSVTANQN